MLLDLSAYALPGRSLPPRHISCRNVDEICWCPGPQTKILSPNLFGVSNPQTSTLLLTNHRGILNPVPSLGPSCL